MFLGVPMFLAARAWEWFDRWTNQRVCQAVGCDTSWVYAASVGSIRPVCQRCGAVAGERKA